MSKTTPEDRAWRAEYDDADYADAYDADPTPIFPAPTGTPRREGPLDITDPTPRPFDITDPTPRPLDITDPTPRPLDGDQAGERQKRVKRSRPAKPAQASRRRRGGVSWVASLLLVAGLVVVGVGVWRIVRSGPDDPNAAAVPESTDGTGPDAVSLDPSLTPTQQRAARAALELLDWYPTSRTKLVEDLSSEYADERFSLTDAAAAVDSLNIDWNVKAVESAKAYLEQSAFSQDGLRRQLTGEVGEKFSPDEAAFAIGSIDVDWDAQAVRYAQLFLDSSGISRVKLFHLMTAPDVGGFTEQQSNAALDQLDVDWNAEAAEQADDIKSRQRDIGCDDMIDLLWGQSGAGFAPEQARAGAEAVGVC